VTGWPDVKLTPYMGAVVLYLEMVAKGSNVCHLSIEKATNKKKCLTSFCTNALACHRIGFASLAIDLENWFMREISKHVLLRVQSSRVSL